MKTAPLAIALLLAVQAAAPSPVDTSTIGPKVGPKVGTVVPAFSGPGQTGATRAKQANPMAPAPNAARSDTMHLTVHASISDAAVAPGKRVSLVFDVTPKRHMHVYAPGKHDYQVIAVKVDPRPWLRVQPTTYPPSEIYHFKELDEKVETYGKPFKLVQDVTILATPEAQKLLAASPSIDLSGRLEYQACDDKVCYAPARVPFSFPVSVKVLDRKPPGD